MRATVARNIQQLKLIDLTNEKAWQFSNFLHLACQWVCILNAWLLIPFYVPKKVAFLGIGTRKGWCRPVELVTDDFEDDYTCHREERYQAHTYIEVRKRPQRQSSLWLRVAGGEIEKPELEIAVHRMNRWEVPQLSERNKFPEENNTCTTKSSEDGKAVWPDRYEVKAMWSKCTIQLPLVYREQVRLLPSPFHYAAEFHAD